MVRDFSYGTEMAKLCRTICGERDANLAATLFEGNQPDADTGSAENQLESVETREVVSGAFIGWICPTVAQVNSGLHYLNPCSIMPGEVDIDVPG